MGKSRVALTEFRISRVAADPPVVGTVAKPGGWNGLFYFRLHGSPRVYYSEYRSDQLEHFVQQLAPKGSPRPHAWCIFDNTASGAATVNALALQTRLRGLAGSHNG